MRNLEFDVEQSNGKISVRQQFELDIEQLKGKLGVTQHVQVDGSEKKIDELRRQLEEKEKKIESLNEMNALLFNKVEVLREQMEEKEEAMEVLNEMNAVLLTKERRLGDDLQAARKELIEHLKELGNPQTEIGVKKMGELDLQLFRELCNERYSPDEGDVNAAELCSYWEEQLRNPDWYPIKVVANELVIKEDKKLKELKETLGEKIHDAVVHALIELVEYNGSGRYAVPEIWNFNAKRKATTNEAVQYVMKQWKTNKRKQTWSGHRNPTNMQYLQCD